MRATVLKLFPAMTEFAVSAQPGTFVVDRDTGHALVILPVQKRVSPAVRGCGHDSVQPVCGREGMQILRKMPYVDHV